MPVVPLRLKMCASRQANGGLFSFCSLRRGNCLQLHNARAILRDFRRLGDALWSRFNGGKKGTLWYYRSLVTAFRQAGNSELIEELDRVVTELKQLAGKS